MTLAQYEKYIDAAKDALRHLRLYPVRAPQTAARVIWKPFPQAVQFVGGDLTLAGCFGYQVLFLQDPQMPGEARANAPSLACCWGQSP